MLLSTSKNGNITSEVSTLSIFFHVTFETRLFILEPQNQYKVSKMVVHFFVFVIIMFNFIHFCPTLIRKIGILGVRMLC